MKIWFQNRRTKRKKVEKGASDQEDKEGEETEHFCDKKIDVGSPHPDHISAKANILILKIYDYSNCT